MSPRAAPKPSPHERASDELAAVDPVLEGLVRAHGRMRLPRPTPVGDRLEVLSRSVAYQQLNGRAAETIWGRARALVDGPWEPESVLEVPIEDWRGAGLSGAKAAALVDLARCTLDGTIDFARIGRRSDDEVVAELTQARGIGPWTAHMFLMFHLGRLDVWPTGDYGVRNGYAVAFGLDEMPSPKELEVLGDRFRPYRSVVAWYCWRAVDTRTPD